MSTFSFLDNSIQTKNNRIYNLDINLVLKQNNQ